MVNPFIVKKLILSSLAFCLILRFEFMGSGISKLVAFLANAGLVMMIYLMMSDVMA